MRADYWISWCEINFSVFAYLYSKLYKYRPSCLGMQAMRQGDSADGLTVLE